MPEGPEVQVIVDSLKNILGDSILLSLDKMKSSKVFGGNLNTLENHRILEIRREGKNIVFELDEGFLIIHLGMTGFFSYKEKENSILRIKTDKTTLFYSDPRGFGRVQALDKNQWKEYKPISTLGLDPLKNSSREIFMDLRYKQYKSKNREIKPLLMDYRVISGIGNIYASEILYAARIVPTRKFGDLSEKELERIAEESVRILKVAYKSGGSTIESFHNVNGESGNFQNSHMVYQQRICKGCGGEIISFKQNGRSTFYCPKEQK